MLNYDLVSTLISLSIVRVKSYVAPTGSWVLGIDTPVPALQSRRPTRKGLGRHTESVQHSLLEDSVIAGRLEVNQLFTRARRTSSSARYCGAISAATTASTSGISRRARDRVPLPGEGALHARAEKGMKGGQQMVTKAASEGCNAAG